MAVNLEDYADALRRAVTPLGSQQYADISDASLTAYLTDAFWSARLDGFLKNYTANEDGRVTHLDDGPDMDRAWVSLIVLYAAISILSNQILSTNTGFRAKAGPVEFEQENSATVLAEMLRQLAAAKQRILDDLRDVDATTVYLVDAYSTRMLSAASYYGSPGLVG